jgi:hypothetical protein
MVSIPLLLGDAAELIAALRGPQWGIYRDGDPVITPANPFIQSIAGSFAGLQDIASAASAVFSIPGMPNIILPSTASTASFEFAGDSPISNYPQEQGAFQSYDKVTLPYEIKLRLANGGSTSQRQAFLATCLSIRNSLDLYDVLTPEMTFPSVNCHHIDWRREASRGATLIVVELWFQQVPVTASTSFQNTQSAAAAGPQSLGNVQSQTPSTSGGTASFSGLTNQVL